MKLLKKLPVLLAMIVLPAICLCQELACSDYPSNPIKKRGWILTCSDEFEDDTLNTDLWIPYYFRHRASDKDTKATYRVQNGKLFLQIENKFAKVSSIQSMERPNLHKPGPRSDVNTELKFAQKYGYFEIRAKTQGGSGYHCAFWMIGIQENSNQTAEIDIFEQPGNLGSSTILYNLYAWGDSKLRGKLAKEKWQNKINLGVDLTNTFNIYGLEWTKSGIKLYFNNKLIKTIDKSPKYPMAVLLSIYQGAGWTGSVENTTDYPKQFIIDYFRAYKRRP